MRQCRSDLCAFSAESSSKARAQPLSLSASVLYLSLALTPFRLLLSFRHGGCLLLFRAFSGDLELSKQLMFVV